VLGAALLVALWSGRVAAARTTGGTAAASRSGRLVYGAVAGAFLIVVSGAYVVGSGASAACSGWPQCGAAPGGLADVHFLHRVVVLVAGMVILIAASVAARHWRGAPIAMAAYGTAAALLAEVGIGAAQVWLHLPEALRTLHLAMATLVWTGVVLMAWSHWLETRPAALPREVRPARVVVSG